MTELSTSPKTPWLRNLVLVIAGLQAALFVFLELYFLASAASMDPLGRSIAQAVAMLIPIPFVLFTLPALVLAVMRRWLPLAAILALLAIPATFFIFAIM